MEQIVIKQDLAKQILMIFGNLIMITAAVFLILVDITSTTSIMDNIFKYAAKPVGVLGVLFFGTVFIFVVCNVIKNKDLLVINSDGFSDYSTLLSVGFVPWSNVESVAIRTKCSQKFIFVKVKNRAELLSKLHVCKRAILSMFPSSPLVAINPSTAKKSGEDICDLINKYIEKRVK